MYPDKYEFFREATLRICSNLDIETALHATLLFLAEMMPVSKMALEHFDSEIKAMRTIAKADSSTGLKVDMVTPLSEEAIKRVKTRSLENKQKVYLYSDPAADRLAKEMLDFHGIEASSLMVLVLTSGDRVLGTLALIAEGENTFTEHHVELTSLLCEPFTVALSNTLKHRDELKLFDRNFFWEVTKRICGNLDIEKGLQSCFQYITRYMPGNSIYLQNFEPELKSMRLFAHATHDTCEKIDTLVPLSVDAMQALMDLAVVWRNGELPAVLTINDPDEPVTKNMLSALNLPPSSALSLPLIIENQIIGSLALLAEGSNRYNEKHSKLYGMMKDPLSLAMSNTLIHEEVVKLKELLQDDNRYLQQELQHQAGDNIIGSNFGLKGVMEMVRQVADMDSPVLLLGETGTGKDLIANAIHYSSSRRDHPFISVNCGAIPESLIDSELFGHEKGAFTGALAKKRGRFERADKGTIFLDEVGELPPQAQVRLLRVLQNREIERVGGTETISLDIRIVAATNKNLQEMVKEGKFREDLWFRLNVFPIMMPPLRERRADIPALLQYFIAHKVRDLKFPDIPELAPGTIDILMEYPWPGNVRELENVVERALILNRGALLNFEHLQQTGKKPEVLKNAIEDDTSFTLDEVNIRHIKNVLKKTAGRIHGPGGAAEILGINPSTLRNRMKKLGLRSNQEK